MGKPGLSSIRAEKPGNRVEAGTGDHRPAELLCSRPYVGEIAAPAPEAGPRAARDELGNASGAGHRALGAVRALMAQRGIRGPAGSFLFMNLRLLNDQTLENATGVGAPPWTWPVDEQAIDLLHKAVYAFVTGAVADRLVPERAPLERRREADSPW